MVTNENISAKDNVLILQQTGMKHEQIADTLNDLDYTQTNGRRISRRFVKLTIKAAEQASQSATRNPKQRFINRNHLFAVLRAKGIR